MLTVLIAIQVTPPGQFSICLKNTAGYPNTKDWTPQNGENDLLSYVENEELFSTLTQFKAPLLTT